MQLVNVGTGVGVYKGVNGVGAKELKTLLGSNLITLTNNANEIVITVNEAALNTLIGGIQSVTKTSDLINDGENGDGTYLESIVKEDTSITLILDAGDVVIPFWQYTNLNSAAAVPNVQELLVLPNASIYYN